MLEDDVPSAEAQDALGRVLSSPEFATAARLAAFLRHVVTESIEGRGANLKGYSIAVDVFDRPADFDQTTDPIVRVEASRLRRALAQYYQGSGAADPVVIELPRGGYVPAFRRRAAGAVAVEPEASAGSILDEDSEGTPSPIAKMTEIRGVRGFRWLMGIAVALMMAALAYLVWVASRLPINPPASQVSASAPDTAAPAQAAAARFQPVIAVRRFENLGSDPADAMIARGLTEELVADLARFQEFVVYAVDGEAGLPRSGYVVTGAVRHVGADLRVTVQLGEVPGGRAIWTETYERVFAPGNLLAVQDEIAASAATAIGQPYGAVYDREAARAASRPETLDGHACVLSVYAYWRNFDPKAHMAVRDCLERTVASDPAYADAWQMLTYMYLDEYRYGYNARPLTAYRALDKALDTAQRAVALAATDARSYAALYAVYYYRGDFPAFRRAGADALRLNANSPEIMADFGNKLVAMGAYDEGAALIRKAIALNPGHPGWYNIGLVLEAYRRGDYGEALAAADRMNLPLHYHSWVYYTMIYGQTGEAAKAKAASEELLKLQPDFPLNAHSDLKKWGMSDALAAQCVEGLKKAGLAIPDL